MPEKVVSEWLKDRAAWLTRHQNIGLTNQEGVRLAIEKLSPEQKREYHRLFSARWEAYLDNCHGLCPLRSPQAAKVVANSLRHFDDDRYLMTDFVVMPNHVHLIAAFADEDRMLKQCDSWKHFTATQLNKLLNRKGRFWEPESFDHLVRSEEQWRYLRDYIADNPRRAKLRSGEYVHYSRVFA